MSGLNRSQQISQSGWYLAQLVGQVERFRGSIVRSIENNTNCSEDGIHYQVGNKTMDTSGLGNIMYGFFMNQFPDSWADAIADNTQAFNLGSLGQRQDNPDDHSQIVLGRAIADQIGYNSSISPSAVERLASQTGLQ